METHQTNNNPVPKNFDYEISLLVLAKKTGLSFDELSLFTLNDFIKYVDMYMGTQEQEQVLATQTDIDSFYKM